MVVTAVSMCVKTTKWYTFRVSALHTCLCVLHLNKKKCIIIFLYCVTYEQINPRPVLKKAHVLYILFFVLMTLNTYTFEMHRNFFSLF